MVKVNDKLIRRKLFLIVDTETFNGFEEPIVYDIGFAVIDRTGKVYAQYSFVVHDTFIGMAEQAATAYYANKFPQCHADIREGKRRLMTWEQIIHIVNAVLDKWDISDIVAHNANFDCKATNHTSRLLHYNSFFKRHVEWWDTLQMANDTICKQKSYIRFCQENGYMTRHQTPRPQMKAEVIYRYISGNNAFVESHTGLEDCMIEKEIFSRCCRQHKPMKHTFYVYR